MRYSRQREIILQELVGNPIHPTADKLYDMLKGENPSLSLATVYRNLNQLSSQGKITKLPQPSGSDRFDGETKPHYHMLCTDCGGFFDCPQLDFEKLDEWLSDETHFHVTSHQLTMYGLCEACFSKQSISGAAGA